MKKNAYELRVGDIFRLCDGEALHQRIHQYGCETLCNKSHPPEVLSCLLREKPGLVIARTEEELSWRYEAKISWVKICILEPNTTAVCIASESGEYQLVDPAGMTRPAKVLEDVWLVDSRAPEIEVTVDVVGKMQNGWRLA